MYDWLYYDYHNFGLDTTIKKINLDLYDFYYSL